MLNSVKLKTKPSALALASVLALAAGCGQGQTPSASPTPSSSISADPVLQKVAQPPATPPDASVGGTQLPPLSSTWYDFTTKSFETVSPTAHPSTLTTITSDASSKQTLSIHSTTKPAKIVVREFEGYDSEGLPAKELPSRECSKDQQSPCRFTIGASSTDVSFTQKETAVFTTVEVYYHIPEIDLDQPFDIVTYGFHT